MVSLPHNFAPPLAHPPQSDCMCSLVWLAVVDYCLTEQDMFGLSEWTTNSVLRTISHVFDHLKTFIFLKCSFIWWENYLGLRQSGKSICLSWERTRVGRQWEGRIQILLPTTVCVSVSRHTHNSHIIKEKTVRWITFEFFYSQLSERADVPPQEITAGEDDGRLRKKKNKLVTVLVIQVASHRLVLRLWSVWWKVYYIRVCVCETVLSEWSRRWGCCVVMRAWLKAEEEE